MVFPPRYFGSVRYYAAMARCRSAVVDLGVRYDKRQKEVHRCTIVDTHAPLTLTVPVSKPQGQRLTRWSQVCVSSHGQWWSDHRVSLESAYGRTPYFEFYIDRFLPWLSDTNIPITDFDRGLDEMVRRTLSLSTDVTYTDTTTTDEVPFSLDGIRDVPYWQIRADRLGFIPGLSILDLIFNMGPEAPLVLEKMARDVFTVWRYR